MCRGFTMWLMMMRGMCCRLRLNHPNAPAKIVKRYLQHMDHAFFPEKPIVPYMDVIHDRAMPREVQRGCTRGCRFCQAGMLYRPVREKTVDELQQQARTFCITPGTMICR